MPRAEKRMGGWNPVPFVISRIPKAVFQTNLEAVRLTSHRTIPLSITSVDSFAIQSTRPLSLPSFARLWFDATLDFFEELAEKQITTRSRVAVTKIGFKSVHGSTNHGYSPCLACQKLRRAEIQDAQATTIGEIVCSTVGALAVKMQKGVEQRKRAQNETPRDG